MLLPSVFEKETDVDVICMLAFAVQYLCSYSCLSSEGQLLFFLLQNITQKEEKKMKKLLSLILVLCVSMSVLAGCGSQQAASEEVEDRQPQEWNLYVAAGMKKPMDVVVAAFQEKTGDTINVNYSSSGALFSQIEQGQPCDLYYTADWIYVDKMEEAGLAASSTKFLSDNIVMVVSEDAKDKVATIEDLATADVTVTICDPSAPVGAYAENGLVSMGLWDSVKDKVVARPSTVNQAAIMVLQNEVDVALIFSSVANSNELAIVDTMDQSDSGEIIFGTVTVEGGNTAVADEFVAFAQDYVSEFEQYGWKAYAE